MSKDIIMILAGAFSIIFGILQFKNKVSPNNSKASTQIISPEDNRAYNRLSGTGLVILGVTFIVYKVLGLFAQHLGNNIIDWISVILLIIGVIASITISIIAMRKYNRYPF